MGLFDRLFRRPRRPERSEPASGLFTARSTTVPPELAGTPRQDEDAPPPPEDLWDQPVVPDEEPEHEPAAAPVVERVPEAEPAEIAALEAFDPQPEPEAEPDVLPDHVVRTDGPVAAEPVEPLWDDATWQSEAVADPAPEFVEPEPVEPEPVEEPAPVEGSTAEDPLLGGAGDVAQAPPPEREPEPVPPLFERPEVVVEPEPEELVSPTAPPPAEEAEARVDEEGRTMRVHDGRLDRRPGPIRMTPSEAIALAQDGPRALRRDRPRAES